MWKNTWNSWNKHFRERDENVCPFTTILQTEGSTNHLRFGFRHGDTRRCCPLSCSTVSFADGKCSLLSWNPPRPHLSEMTWCIFYYRLVWNCCSDNLNLNYAFFVFVFASIFWKAPTDMPLVLAGWLFFFTMGFV